MTTTNVPAISQTATGWIAPAQSEILTGVQADINTAFGGNLNFSTAAPTAGTTAPSQVQLSVTETAIIGNTNDLLIALFNSVDPAYASGRMQDAIGRIYFLTRIPASSTVAQATCSGLAGVVIPLNALAVATDGNVYACQQAGIIPISGNIVLSFACIAQGPIACPATTLNTIYQTIPGWDSISNADDGVIGNNVESRAQFENRRQQSVALNSLGPAQAVLAAIYSVPNVISAYVIDNYQNYPSAAGAAASMVGSISGTTLTITAVASGNIVVGQLVSGPGLSMGVTVTALGTGTGGVGTYTISSSETVSSTTLQFGGVQLEPNSLFACVSGGVTQDVAQAIWSKKAPGCSYNGNTTVTVYDTSEPYPSPGIAYSVTYEIPTDEEIYFNVSILNSPAVPSNAAQLIQNAIINAFVGGDGGQRAQQGSNILSSRFYAGITGLGTWAALAGLTLGSQTAPFVAECTASITNTVMTVTAIASGALAAGQILTGVGIVTGTSIVSQLSGSTGSTGTYQVSVSQTVSSETISALATTSTSIQMLVNQMPVTSSNNIIVNLI